MTAKIRTRGQKRKASSASEMCTIIYQQTNKNMTTKIQTRGQKLFFLTTKKISSLFLQKKKILNSQTFDRFSLIFGTQ